jgi:hypothetical protein
MSGNIGTLLFRLNVDGNMPRSIQSAYCSQHTLPRAHKYRSSVALLVVLTLIPIQPEYGTNQNYPAST